MSLNLSHLKNYTSKILWGIIIIFCAFFLLKVYLWENYYYAEKEGSERATTEAVLENQDELDETEPTEQEIAEYTVPASNPRYLTIPKLNIKNAKILSLGAKTSGELSTPANIFDAGWYNQSGTPGSGKTIVIDGHNGGPTKYGIFKQLPELSEGDKIQIERGDGKIFTYKVVENNQVSLSDANAYMKTALTSPMEGIESLTIISCSGEWSNTKRTYLSRQFVRAIIVNE